MITILRIDISSGGRDLTVETSGLGNNIRKLRNIYQYMEYKVNKWNSEREEVVDIFRGEISSCLP